jgi:hypothetical protein
MTGPTGEAAKILRKFGIPINQVELAEIGMGEAMNRVNQMIAKRPELLAKAFPNIRASKAINALTTKQMVKQRAIIARINQDTIDGTGFNKAYVDQLKGFNQEMARAKGRTTVFAAELGEVLAPAVRGVGGLFEDFATFIRINREEGLNIDKHTSAIGNLLGFITGQKTAEEANLSKLENFLPSFGDNARNNTTKAEVDVNLRGAPGTVDTVSQRTEGKSMKVGVNAEEVL